VKKLLFTWPPLYYQTRPFLNWTLTEIIKTFADYKTALTTA